MPSHRPQPRSHRERSNNTDNFLVSGGRHSHGLAVHEY